jgi:hypothetical protein
VSQSSRFRALSFALLALAVCAQSQTAPATPDSNDIAQLRTSLAAAQAQVRQCQDEIAALRQQVQQIQSQLGKQTSSSAASAADFPTLSSITAQEKNAPAAEQFRSEEDQLLAAKVAEYEQTKIESVSKYKVRLSGLILMNLSGNRGNVDISDLPNLAFGNVPTQTNGSMTGTLRQTQLGLQVTGPQLAGAQTSGNVQVDFFGGFPDANYGVTAGLVRLRTAELRMDWPQTSLIAAQAPPFFSPLSPTSYATLGEPALSWSGNLWVWTPQLVVEHRWAIADDSQLAIQAGFLDPLTEEIPDFQFNRTPTAGEKSRAPAFGSHIGWKKKLSTGELSLGAGGYYSRQNWDFGRTTDSWVGSADWNLPLAHRLALSGEFYRGRAIGGLGGGIWASALFSGPYSLPTSSINGLNDIGGWAQLKFRATSRLEFNTAFGSANPFAQDLLRFAAPLTTAFTPLARNQTFFVNGVYRPRSNLLLALEYRRLQTSMLSGTKNTADHINLAAGVSF